MGLKLRSGNNPEERGSRVCLICDGEIAGTHVAVTTRNNEYCVHPSCVISTIPLIIGGIGFLIQYFGRDKNQGRNDI